MATIKHEAKASVETLLTTQMNNLGIGSYCIDSGGFSNDAANELYLYADFCLYLAQQGSARSAGAKVTVWILPEVNNQYPYGSASLAPQAELCVGSFSFDAALNYRTAVLRDIPLPPSDFRVMVQNNTGVAFASSGSTLKMERHNLQVA